VVIRLERLADVADAADDDPLILWAAQTLVPPVRAWTLRSAVAVASPGLSCRDRLALRGDPGDAVPLVRGVLAEVGPAFRPLAPEELVERVVADVPWLDLAGRFGWMDVTAAPTGPVGSERGEPSWLGVQEMSEVARSSTGLSRPRTRARAALKMGGGPASATAMVDWCRWPPTRGPRRGSDCSPELPRTRLPEVADSPPRPAAMW
jgi:hypothetical protein